MRRSALVAMALLVAAVGCRDGTVRVAFRPEPGATYTYRVTVSAEVTTVIGDRPARHSTDQDVFTARHTVLSSGRTGSRVRIRLESADQEPRTFVVRLDRAGQLVEVQSIEGIPTDALGALGLSEIFPAAAAAPPDRALAPGDRWSISEASIRGTGRLAELDVDGGHRRATLESDYVVPVERTSDEGDRRLRLSGRQRTRATATHDLVDGAVDHVEAETTGTFRLLLLPPKGETTPSVPGRQEVRVRSETTRVR